MPRFLASLIPIAILTAAAPAGASPADDMQTDIETKSWTHCLMTYRGALRDGAKDTDLKDLAATCLSSAKADPDATHDWVGLVELQVGSLRGSIASLKSGESTDYKSLLTQVNACSDAVAQAAQVIDPSTQVTVSTYGQPDWKGSITDAQTVCDQGVKASEDAKQKLLGPYEKAGIKGDKLALIADHLDVYFNVPGGETTSEPKKLAAASVLFLAWGGSLTCRNGEPWRLERFQFDKAQKLVKTTAKEYCGDPPKSAYR